ncbi:MAG: 1-(5-phosphoribosyl)-5-[(5-phosphoribosylamino)methylideneamino]imidazole-4-carboxamide isomerase [Ruminococcaceae bacterium]|nr:1-(5-phosphoribosyl)-5-[(5-phosphoribosylamino)methylideneamino]imidazole-4-carboxamide isomerase [Oscillospiraceae bacterium]
MNIFPAIDLYEGKAVRLYKGDYNKITVYSENPEMIAQDFAASGARHLHLVDLEGAKSGDTPNIEVIKKIIAASGLFTEVGGGIRSMETVDKYLSSGVSRVILGTAALKDREFLLTALEKYGERIAVGADIKDGKIAIKGWTETSDTDIYDFCRDMQEIGVKTIICTDISKDGAMMGTNHELYRELSRRFDIDLIASGGVSSMEDVRRLCELGIYGCIIGKAYYTGAISIKEAVEAAKEVSDGN